ncbi:MAG: EAL domain-containing protein [Acidimicrobiales bacterium]
MTSAGSEQAWSAHTSPGSPPAGGIVAPELDGELLARLLESSPDGIMALEAVREAGEIVDFVWLVVNPAAERIVGRRMADLVGRRLLVEMPGNRTSGLFDRYVAVTETGRPHEMEHHYDHEGLDNWFHTVAVRFGDGFAVTFRDITAHKKAAADLAHMATHDELTGLANRALFEKRVARALKRNSPRRQLAVMFCDLDRFKILNDSLGHSHGDETLGVVARRLSEAVRPGDLVARFGGDEFVILCEDLTGAEEAAAIARRILERLREPLEDSPNRISASIGIALDDGAGTPEVLLRDADTAMYRTKDRGGDGFDLFDDTLRAAAVARLQTEVELRSAISRDELRVLYQPIVHLASGRFIGAEGLLRWNHPARGRLTASQFIAVAEDSDLIVDIGCRVIDDACRVLRRWADRGHTEVGMAVNIAARQIIRDDLVETVEQALERHGAPAGGLCLELTETTLMSDPATVRRVLKRISDLGVALALDDFGTGFSSLSHARDFPVDFLKLDRSFIAGLGWDRSATAIVRSVIDLAHAIERPVIAEGVENERQLELLLEMGAEYAQGFYFAKPCEPHQLLAMLGRQAS